MRREPLIFSLSRAALLNRCPRRFFYRYIYAAHSLDESAPAERQLTRKLSRAVGLPLFFRRIVQRGLRLALSGEPWPECLYREYRAALCSQFSSHCPLPLRELHSGEKELPVLRRTLRRALKRFRESSAPRMLLKTDPGRLRLFEEISSVQLADVCWLSTPFCCRRIGTHWEFFEFAGSEFAMRNLFHRYWALQNHFPLGSVRSCFIAPDGSVTRFCETPETTPLLDFLRGSAEKMAELSLYSDPDAVVAAGDTEVCGGCPYSSICARV